MEHKYLFVAVDAALKAGEEILSIYTDPASDFEIERKADHSPLTIKWGPKATRNNSLLMPEGIRWK